MRISIKKPFNTKMSQIRFTVFCRGCRAYHTELLNRAHRNGPSPLPLLSLPLLSLSLLDKWEQARADQRARAPCMVPGGSMRTDMDTALQKQSRRASRGGQATSRGVIMCTYCLLRFVRWDSLKVTHLPAKIHYHDTSNGIASNPQILPAEGGFSIGAPPSSDLL
jgi:hypothetical protein